MAALVARASIARGKYQEAETALRPIAQRAPTSDAALELGLLLKMLGRPDANAVLERVAIMATRATEAGDLARGARALRALGRFQESKSAFLRRRDRLAARSGDSNRLRRAVPRKVQPGRSVEVVPGGAEDRFQVDAGAARCGAHARRRGSETGERHGQGGARHQSVRRRSARVRRRRVGRRRPQRRGAQGARGRARRQSVEPRRARAARRASRTSRTRRRNSTPQIGKALAINPHYGEAYRVAAQLTAYKYPLRRSARARPEGARARPAESAQPLGHGRVSAAHRRRAVGARGASSGRSISIRSTTSCARTC